MLDPKDMKEFQILLVSALATYVFYNKLLQTK